MADKTTVPDSNEDGMSTKTTRVTITRDSLPKVIAKAYELSQPQGMGFLHAMGGEIPSDVLHEILVRTDSTDHPFRKAVSMDYVQGRAIKLRIHFDPDSGTYYLEDTGNGWYDHSPGQWRVLLDFAQAVSA